MSTTNYPLLERVNDPADLRRLPRAELKALATEGIQRGHMSLHARQVAMAAGAQGEAADRIAAQMIRDNRISLSHAAELLEKE